MANSARKLAAKLSISALDDASRSTATSPAVQSENEAVNQHVDRQALLKISAPIPASPWRGSEIGQAETPPMALYREWVAARYYADHVIRDSEGYDSSDDRDAFIGNTLNPIQKRMEDAPISSIQDLLAKVRVELDYAFQMGHEELRSRIEECLVAVDDHQGELSALLVAYRQAYEVHVAAIKKTDTTEPGPEHEAAFAAQGKAIDVEDDIVTRICRYRPTSEPERFERTAFLRRFLSDVPPTDEMIEALLDRPALPARSACTQPSPIMGLFDQWNAARDAVNGHAEKAGDEDEAEFKRLCYRMDDLMVQIAVLPATDARDFAAKLSSLTHYGVYDELAGDVWGLGSALIREAAELIGHPEHVVEAHREPASLKANLAPNQSQKAA